MSATNDRSDRAPGHPGPRTAAGRAKCSQNATRHGLTSRVAVLGVLGETVEAWQAHRDGIVASLAPVGALETELAERVAMLTWRQRRVARAERGLVTSGIEAAENLAVADVLFDTADVDDAPATLDDLREHLGHERRGGASTGALASAERRVAQARDAAVVPTCSRGEALNRYA